MAKRKKPKLRVKCPWCGRMVGFSKSENLEPHVGPGGVRCVGEGQPKHQILDLVELKAERAKAKKG
jgi:hypothetical protein